MKMYFRFILIMFILFFTSCLILEDSDSDRIIGRYVVLWTDFVDNRGINLETELNSPSSIQIIPEYVFAVGHNDKFIWAKQHPGASRYGGRGFDKEITNYYFIDIMGNNPLNNYKVYGPLNVDQFYKMGKKFGIGSILFDQIYPEEI